jgi:hypothetical protein
MRYQETSTASRCSENDCWDCGGADCDAGAKGIASLGTVRLSWADDGYLNQCSILIPRSASPPIIRDKNRMRFYEKVIKVKADVAPPYFFSPTLRQAPEWRGELSRAPFFGVHLDP